MSAWQGVLIGAAAAVFLDRTRIRVAAFMAAQRERRAFRDPDIEFTRDLVVTQVREGVIEAVRRHLDGPDGTERTR